MDLGPGGERLDATGADIAADNMAQGFKSSIGCHFEAWATIFFELWREHQAEEIGVFEGEGDIGLAHDRHRILGIAGGDGFQGRGKTLEARHGERFEESRARIEMAIRGGRGHADRPRQIAKT